MTPKRDAATRAKKALTPIRVISDRDDDGDDDSYDREQQARLRPGRLNPTFDRTIGPPSSGKGKEAAEAAETSGTAPSVNRDDFILEQQAEQAQQLRQLFSLVSSLGSEIKTVVERVTDIGSSREPVEAATQSGPPQRRVKVGFVDPPLDQEEEEEEESDDEDDEQLTSGDTYVSHAVYRERIAEGFAKRSPSRLASNKPAYFPIDDPVTRSLNASKYSAKATEYSLTVANAFYASVTKAALDDAISGFANVSDPGAVFS
jgi:hypothetical protein